MKNILIAITIFIVLLCILSYTSKHDTRLITTDQLEKIDFTMTTLKRTANGTCGTIEGQIQNNSNYSLASFKYKVVVYDCLFNDCKTIGEEIREQTISIPPNQIRQFKHKICFDNMPEIENEYNWYLRFLETKAK